MTGTRPFDVTDYVAAGRAAETELGANPGHYGHQIAATITSSGRPTAITNPATAGALTASTVMGPDRPGRAAT
ncbi:hypothetical protein ACFWPH_25095 [Nocardia sp. NPDC058499]|uniref:hypothetical protein n=1 Tax=Nocardia sp. NPDC058499 TaxID=3346530 RepID=UPI003659FF1F